MIKECTLTAAFIALILLSGCDAQDTPVTTTQSVMSAEPEDTTSHLTCADPLNAFLAETQAQANEGALSDEAQSRFLSLIAACKAAYLTELDLIDRDYAKLPETGTCHQRARHYREEVRVFDAFVDMASEPQRPTPHGQLEVYNILGSGLIVQLATVTLHRMGNCSTEAYDPARVVLNQP
ncbi:MAG: hypothetical protein CVV07_04195 [Gammaproteobacteria bacterium HGW-Gammaproteobacteria-11]|nr:MAG: hypothetical protein CVV07_04195 [Gammaproteobacteria bacterium HGW-Gammaproteobacteria-11]